MDIWNMIKKNITGNNNMPMLYKTEVAKSNIHGLGLFAKKLIKKGSVFWKHDYIIDGWVDIVSAEKTQYDMFLEHIDYFYCYDEALDLYIRPSDNLIFINHSDSPNLDSPSKYMHIANKDIEKGEELTLNYRDICDYGWQTVEKINNGRRSED
jgi:SET domain-containing protein